MSVMKIVSGGQDGADRTGLETARELGIETSGYCPANYRTDKGCDPSLADFGLICTPSSSYPPRTALNVMGSDGTVWFGNPQSPGGRLTYKLVLQHRKKWIANPTPAALKSWIDLHSITVLNVAGNRSSTNPGVIAQTRDTLLGALQ